MPKMKIKKSISKRFRVTKTGKVLHLKQMGRHLKMNKSKRRKRTFKKLKTLHKSFGKKLKKLLGR